MRSHSKGWILLGGLIALAACGESGGPSEIGPPAEIVVIAGSPQFARANVELATPIQVSVRDANGRGVANQTVTFTITAGGGTLSGGVTTATAGTDANGTATLPTWKLGKSALAQTVRASLGTITTDISATVQTNYHITIRFFGDPMSAAQQALFSNAAARISGIIIGDVIDADARGGTIDPAQCGVTGQPNLNEIIDDVLIYASIQAIDGPGMVLAQAGPCFVRGTATGDMTAVGTMQFDSADLATLSGSGSLQEVITHEMIHVVGVGTLWVDRGHLTGAGTVDPRYTGNLGRQGCVTVGGTVSCATSIPVENDGGSGTADSHWREATFNSEMMTGFLDSGANPISSMTIGSLADLGFVINAADNDPYTIFIGALRSSNLAATARTDWERMKKPIGVLENGRIRPVRSR